MTVCLDSWAVLRWLEDVEPAASRVDEALKNRPVMSWINLGEVFYVVHRIEGPGLATEIVQDLRSRMAMDAPTVTRVLEAARIKAVCPMAYADAFAVATAQAHDVALLTADPEIINAPLTCAVEDLR